MDAGGGQAHATCAAVEIAGDDIPADAPVGEMIERREAAGQLIGVLERQVRGDAEAEMLRCQRHGGDQQRRFGVRQLHGMTHRRVRTVAEHVIDAEDIGEEDAIEQSALRRPGVVDPVIERVVVDRGVARVRPQARPVMARSSHVERVEEEFSWFRHGSLPARHVSASVRHAVYQLERITLFSIRATQTQIMLRKNSDGATCCSSSRRSGNRVRAHKKAFGRYACSAR